MGKGNIAGNNEGALASMDDWIEGAWGTRQRGLWTILEKTKCTVKEGVMKRYTCLSLICFIVVLIVFAASLPGEAQEKVIKLRYANFLPAVHKVSTLSEQWCKEVEKRTNNRIEFSYLPGGTLVPAPQGYEAAVRGIADISAAAPSWTAGRFPLWELMELPLGYNNPAQATALANAFFKKFKPKEFDEVKVHYIWTNGPGVFMTVKPASSIDGLKGLKIRAGGAQMSKIVVAMGATPVSVPNADIYEGLQRGVIDGILFYPEGLKGWKYGDLIRGLQDNPGIGNGGTIMFVMNEQKWASLPSDIQKIIDQINEEWTEKMGKLALELDNEGREYGVSKGMKIFKISPEEARISAERVKPLLDAFVKDAKGKGLPGEEALKYCQDWLKAHPK